MYQNISLKNERVDKMSNQNSRFVTVSSRDIITFLDDVRMALGLSQRQMDNVLSLLAKADGAYLQFRVGNIGIYFGSNSLEDSGDKEIPVSDKEITVEMSNRQKNCTNTVSYKIPQIYIRSVMKKSLFE
jgi:hypothetical protein